MEVVCIDDKNRPEGMPISKWVREDNKYTVTKVDKLGMMGGQYGVQLAEIDLSGTPFKYFLAYRFEPTVDGETLNDLLENELEAIKELTKVKETDKVL